MNHPRGPSLTWAGVAGGVWLGGVLAALTCYALFWLLLLALGWSPSDVMRKVAPDQRPKIVDNYR